MHNKCDKNLNLLGYFIAQLMDLTNYKRLIIRRLVLAVLLCQSLASITFCQSTDQSILDLISKGKEYFFSQADSCEYYFTSALELVTSQTEDSVRASLYLEMSDFLIEQSLFEQADSFVQLALPLIDLGSGDHVYKRSARLHVLHALIQNRDGALGKAEASYEMALSDARKMSEPEKQLASIYNSMAGFHNGQGDFDKGAEYQLKNIEMNKELGDSSNMAIGYLNLSLVHSNSGAPERGQEAAQKAFDISSKIKDLRLKAYAAQFVATTYSDLDDHEQALIYAEESLKSWREINNPGQEGVTLRIIGLIHKALSNSDQYGQYIKESHDKIKTLEDPVQLMYAEQLLGMYYVESDAPARGIPYLKKVADQVSESQGNSVLLRDTYLNLSEAFENLNDYKSAYDYRLKYESVHDTLRKAERLTQIDQLETEFEVKEKELTIERQEAQLELEKSKVSRNRNILIGASVLGVAFLFLANLYFNIARKRKAVNLELVQLDETRSRFFANITHELKTPLTLILGPLEEALASNKNNYVGKQLKVVQNNGHKLLTLINEILDLSKLENDQIRVELTDVHLNQLLRRIIASFESQCAIQKINLLLDNQTDSNLYVKMDVSKFERIIQNLISNAIKFSPIEGVIQLIVQREGRQFSFKVKDEGPGISKADQKRLFERYFQTSAGAELGGVGIGLSLSQELAHLMNGTIQVSGEKGRGSSFTLSLPLKRSDASIGDFTTGKINSEIAEEDEEVLMSPVTKKRADVLIVEDNHEMAEYLKGILKEYYYCTIVHDGKQALEMLQEKKFSCVTSDIMMPTMDGFEFVKKLRQSEMLRRMPVIMISARALEEDILRGFQLGIDDYLTKPFRKNELLARVKNLVDRKMERDQSLDIEGQEEIALSADDQMIVKIRELIHQNLSNENFKVEDMAREMNYSQRQLERILKKLTGYSPSHFIREVRLQQGYSMIQSRRFATIAEVRNQVGFANASYFSKVFFERFGVRPGEIK